MNTIGKFITASTVSAATVWAVAGVIELFEGSHGRALAYVGIAIFALGRGLISA